MIRVSAGSFVRPIATESVAGDACLVATWSRGVVLATADGLGHGPSAAAASTAFLERVREARDEPLATMFEGAHRALLKTRGAVAAVARFDEHEASVEVVGVGNVAVLLGEGRREPRPLVMPSGVLGSAFRPVRPQVFAFAAGDVLLLHTDGVGGRFPIAPLRSLEPDALAHAVVKTYGKPTDDAACAVALGTPPSQVAGDARPTITPAGTDDAISIPVAAPDDVESGATEARAFASRLGFGVRAQWQVGAAASELLAYARQFSPEGRLTLTHVLAPREHILAELSIRPSSPSAGRRPGEGLGSVQLMMDRVSIVNGAGDTRIVARKFKG
jgi:Stage II sporulation protein E (SpoIIE)